MMDGGVWAVQEKGTGSEQGGNIAVEALGGAVASCYVTLL